MDEIRDGFLVSDARKKLWEVELQMLDKVEMICEMYNISYFLIGGAAIGAVRHKGFIPWDDDLDIGMLRCDFEKFIKIIQKEGIGPYSVQYGVSDFPEKGTFLRIRDPETTAMIKSQMGRVHATHGVFIEIYPFDNVPNNKLLREVMRIKSRILKAELDHRIENVPIHGKNLLLKLCFFFLSDDTLWKWWNRICQKYNVKDCVFVDTPSLPQYVKTGIHRYKKSDLSFYDKVQYEEQLVRVAVGNDACLRVHFGDYMKLPPIEQRVARHNDKIFYDPYTSYVDYSDYVIPNRYFEGEHDLSPV